MSDAPRTDAIARELAWKASSPDPDGLNPYFVVFAELADFARELERELAAAHKEWAREARECTSVCTSREETLRADRDRLAARVTELSDELHEALVALGRATPTNVPFQPCHECGVGDDCQLAKRCRAEL